MSSYEEHRRIDWSHPNEENGFYDKGTHGSAWWVSERKRPAVDVVVSQLESVYPYLELPKRNPFSEDLSADQWREVRRRYRERHREVAERLLEEAYKYGKFLEGKDLQSAKENAATMHRWRNDSVADSLREYIDAARGAAEVFHRLAVALDYHLNHASSAGGMRTLRATAELTEEDNAHE